MANLPAGVAVPTLITGKTDKSQVIDAYSKTPVEAKAQNLINSVLDKANGTIFENSKNALVQIVDSKRFYGDLSKTITKFAEGGFTKKSLDSALTDWKNGALSTILQANGAKDLNGLKNNLIGAVETNVKDFAFGGVKGFVDTLQPGLLDQVGIKSFKDAKKIYDGIDHDIRAISKMNSQAWAETLFDPIAIGLSTTVLQASIDVINTTLPRTANPIKLESTNKEIDNAILTGVCKDIIAEDNPHLNDYIFTNFGDLEISTNAEKLNLFVSTTVSDAAVNGSMDYIIKAANFTSPSFVRANNNTSIDNFVKNISFNTKFTNETERVNQEDLIIGSLEVLGNLDKTKGPDLNLFKNLSDDAFDVLKYSKIYGADVAVAKNMDEFSSTFFMNNFADFKLT